MAVINPTYRGSTASQDVWKSFMSSDFIPAPDNSTTNPFWSGSSYLNYMGDWMRETVITTRDLKREVATLKALLAEVLTAVKPVAPAVATDNDPTPPA